MLRMECHYCCENHELEFFCDWHNGDGKPPKCSNCCDCAVSYMNGAPSKSPAKSPPQHYYGTVFVRERDGKYFMVIDDFEREKCQEISQEFFNAFAAEFPEYVNPKS